MLYFRTFLILACFALYSGIVPVFLALMIPMYIFRILVAGVQKLCKPHWVGIMSTRDVIVGLDDYTKRTECAITLLVTLRGAPDIEFIRRVFEKEVLEGKNKKGELGFLRLTYYFETWLGFTFWKKEHNFSIEQHVRLCTPSEIDPSNITGILTEDELLQKLGHLATRPFTRGMSPWEVLIIPNYQHMSSHSHNNQKEDVVSSLESSQRATNLEFALILRMHHAIGDGFSIMKLFVQNLSGDYKAFMPSPLVPHTSLLQKLYQYIGSLVLSPYYILSELLVDIDRSSWHIPRRQLTKRWQFTVTKRISLDAVKETSKNLKVSVTAVLFAGLAGGIRNFLEKQKPDEINTLRPMKAVTPRPWKNHPMDTMVNHWTLCFHTIPVHEPTALGRLLATHRDFESLRKSPLLLTNFIHVPIFCGGPNWLTSVLGSNWASSLIISNFPGPNYSWSPFYGKHICQDAISWIPHLSGDAGCGFLFLSYNGGIRLSISADEAIIKSRRELDQLRELIFQEFLNLQFLSSTNVV